MDSFKVYHTFTGVYTCLHAYTRQSLCTATLETVNCPLPIDLVRIIRSLHDFVLFRLLLFNIFLMSPHPAFITLTAPFRLSTRSRLTRRPHLSLAPRRPIHQPTMTATTESYNKLSLLCKDISNLSSILGLLGWDEQVMMPSGAAEFRGRQKAALTAIVHQKSTSDALRTAIDAAKSTQDTLTPEQRAVVRDAEREYQRAVGVPPELEEAVALQEVASVQAWAAARKNDDFPKYAPVLAETLRLTREKAKAMCPHMQPYDTMIDAFERGMTVKRLDEIFAQISAPLKKILDDTLAAKQKCTRTVHPALLGGDDWEVDGQVKLSNEFAKILGFDLSKGRIDVSVHPFTGGAGPEDVRITTRYSKELPFEGITSTIHEVGHAMYEQGRNSKYDGLPVSEALSMGVHESQSLFWERMIGLNVNFWDAMLPKMHATLPHTKDVSGSDLFFALNQVNPGLIRVDADELTYTFHIILRFELEKKLMSGEITVEDLPELWKKGMKKHLGVDVPSDQKGCLQDIHWPSGAVGYFPSYALGSMMAAQLFHYLKTNVMTDVEDKIAKGEFTAIREWLRKEIHEVGSLYPSMDELLEKVTKEPLNPQYYLNYLEDKYSKVYANE